jgi:hypothetical protein
LRDSRIGVPHASDRYAYLIALVITIGLAAASFVLILNTRIEPAYDQGFIAHDLSQGYPLLEQGLSSRLIAGIVNFFRPYAPISSNALFRALAAAGYILSGGLLAWSLTKDGKYWFFILFMALIYTSRFPFLWLSSEVLAGTFLMLTLWSIVRKLPFVLTAIFLVLFALAKPDLVLPAMLVGIFWILYRNNLRTRIYRGVALALVLGLLLLPGVISYGFAYLRPAGRSLDSFCQHYADMVRGHQVIPGPDPWAECHTYLQATFGPVQSILDVIRASPTRYMDFVFLSLAYSLRRMISANLAFLIVPAILALYTIRRSKPDYIVIVALFLTSLLPIFLLAYLHIRYQARFYPLALFAVFAGISNLCGKWLRKSVVVYLGILLILQFYQIISVFAAGYWFPD